MKEVLARCWCGPGPATFFVIDTPCGGSGVLDCFCGGDLCVCHNHGEVECDGCADCDGMDDVYGGIDDA